MQRKCVEKICIFCYVSHIFYALKKYVFFLCVTHIPGIEGMAAAELELVVMCKIELSEVAAQRHHSAMASRIILMALKMLQSSILFSKTKSFSPQRK